MTRRIAENVGGVISVALILFALFAIASDPTDAIERLMAATGCLAAAWVLMPRRWLHG